MISLLCYYNKSNNSMLCVYLYCRRSYIIVKRFVIHQSPRPCPISLFILQYAYKAIRLSVLLLYCDEYYYVTNKKKIIVNVPTQNQINLIIIIQFYPFHLIRFFLHSSLFVCFNNLCLRFEQYIARYYIIYIFNRYKKKIRCKLCNKITYKVFFFENITIQPSYIGKLNLTKLSSIPFKLYQLLI